MSIAVFVLMRIIPGDIAALILSGPSGELTYTQEDVEELREQMGLNQPIYVQYTAWMWEFIRGDLGRSFVTKREIADQIKRQMPITVQLAMFSLVVISIISIPIGVLAAVRQDSFVDYILRGFAILGLAMPSFFVALLVVLFLSVCVQLVDTPWVCPPLGRAYQELPAAHLPRHSARLCFQRAAGEDDASSVAGSAA